MMILRKAQFLALRSGSLLTLRSYFSVYLFTYSTSQMMTTTFCEAQKADIPILDSADLDCPLDVFAQEFETHLKLL